MKAGLTLASPYSQARIVEILEREMDRRPSVLHSLMTLNARYFSGTAAVCGRVGERGFEMRNRSAPGLSLRARGTLLDGPQGTLIVLEFVEPWIPDLIGSLLGRYERDLEVIVGFLKRWLQADEYQGEPRVVP